MLDLLISPWSVVGTIVGLCLAALLHWLFPSLSEHATALYGSLVAGGFFIGLLIDWGGPKSKS
jgi:hypothetical protein